MNKELDELVTEFYKTFNIQPLVKAGEPCLTTSCRVATVIATEDIWPEFNIQRAWEIEEYLCSREDSVSVNVQRDNKLGLYQYLVEENNEDGERYHHSFANPQETRLAALMSYLIWYANVKDIYDAVRKIFDQDKIKEYDTLPLPHVNIMEVTVTASADSNGEFPLINWKDYDEQEM